MGKKKKLPDYPEFKLRVKQVDMSQTIRLECMGMLLGTHIYAVSSYCPKDTWRELSIPTMVKMYSDLIFKYLDEGENLINQKLNDSKKEYVGPLKG
jgi:hypothetical protein